MKKNAKRLTIKADDMISIARTVSGLLLGVALCSGCGGTNEVPGVTIE